MNMPCPCRVDCPGTDTPIANLTSEPPDRLIFIGYSWGWDLNVPQLGWTFGDPINNPSFCDSTVSQQDAQQCADRNQVGCLVGNCGPGDPGPAIPWTTQFGRRPQTFLSAASFCTVFCADGLPFTYTVKAGLFQAFSQAKADEIAVSYACQQANLNSVCFGSISGACFGQNYLAVISVTGGFGPYSIAKIAGTLPTGVGFVQDTGTTAFLSGVPTATGAFTFTVRAVDTKGNFMQKDFTVRVLDVSNKANIPAPSVGTFYNFQLAGVGGVAPYTFSNAVGLPGGLTLQSDGFIVGNPIAPIGTGFSCTMADSVGNFCTFALTYSACSVFNGLIWPNPPSTFNPPGGGNPYFFNQFFTPPNSIELNGGVAALGFPPTFISGDNVSNVITVPNTGLSCKCTVTVKSSSGFSGYQFQVSDPTFTTFYLDTGFISGTPPLGTTVFNFTIPAGVTQIVVSVAFQFGNAGGVSGALDIIATFG